MNNEIKIYTVDEVLTELNDCIKNKKPFSLIRMGDGGLKFLESILYNNNHSRLLEICRKEGIPYSKLYSIFYMWGKFASNANYIDSPQVYFTDKFWPRFTEQKRLYVLPLIKNWREIYYNAEFNNDRFINPEANFLMLLKRNGHLNLIDIIKNKKVRCITNYKDVNLYLSNVCDSSICEIVGWNENQYEHNYRDVTKEIKRDAKKYDLWLVGAGEIGRCYTGLIKLCGGRSIDIGSVFDVWVKNEIPIRLKGYIKRLSPNDLRFVLTNLSRKYSKYI